MKPEQRCCLFKSPQGSAVLSIRGDYRYFLSRWLTGRRENPRQVTWIMLNPSTADHAVNDATIRRCLRFSRDWGFDLLVVVNLFALRATMPAQLLRHPDPVGPANDHYLTTAMTDADQVVAAWGAYGGRGGRGYAVRVMAEKLADLHCLGTTKDGEPKHPLYLAATTELELLQASRKGPLSPEDLFAEHAHDV